MSWGGNFRLKMHPGGAPSTVPESSSANRRKCGYNHGFAGYMAEVKNKTNTSCHSPRACFLPPKDMEGGCASSKNIVLQ
jgi:hypothetical protein